MGVLIKLVFPIARAMVSTRIIAAIILYSFASFENVVLVITATGIWWKIDQQTVFFVTLSEFFPYQRSCCVMSIEHKNLRKSIYSTLKNRILKWYSRHTPNSFAAMLCRKMFPISGGEKELLSPASNPCWHNRSALRGVDPVMSTKFLYTFLSNECRLAKRRTWHFHIYHPCSFHKIPSAQQSIQVHVGRQ